VDRVWLIVVDTKGSWLNRAGRSGIFSTTHLIGE
jgi:hypothetical protein